MTHSLPLEQLAPSQMLSNLDSFLANIVQLAADVGIEINELHADHIALRINDYETTTQAHQAWLEYGNVISSACINGRPIIVIEFHQPISLGAWTVECLELPYPVEGKIYPKQGWEHVEFVIPSDATEAEQFLQEIKVRFPTLSANWESLAEKGIATKLSSPKGEGERLSNPTVAFKREGVCIKFHPHSLKEVVLSEQAQ